MAGTAVLVRGGISVEVRISCEVPTWNFDIHYSVTNCDSLHVDRNAREVLVEANIPLAVDTGTSEVVGDRVKDGADESERSHTIAFGSRTR